MRRWVVNVVTIGSLLLLFALPLAWLRSQRTAHELRWKARVGDAFDLRVLTFARGKERFGDLGLTEVERDLLGEGGELGVGGYGGDRERA